MAQQPCNCNASYVPHTHEADGIKDIVPSKPKPAPTPEPEKQPQE